MDDIPDQIAKNFPSKRLARIMRDDETFARGLRQIGHLQFLAGHTQLQNTIADWFREHPEYTDVFAKLLYVMNTDWNNFRELFDM